MDLLKDEEYSRANIVYNYWIMRNSKVARGLDHASRLKNVM
jgi:hypothetical protein